MVQTMTENFNTIEYVTKGPIARISLNRPDKLNAINQPMVGELNQALDKAESDDSVRSILLTGNGRAFSAGFDLEGDEDSSPDVEAVRDELTADFDIIMRFWNSPKVTVAAVHGYCLGSAMEMAVACDVTLSAEECFFGAPEVRFGSGIVALILPWVIGPKRSKELLLTGEDRVSAQDALGYGLINRVVPPEELIEQAEALALSIARNDRLAVQMTKQAINRTCEIAGMSTAMQEALDLDIIVESTETEESREFNEILRTQGAKAAIEWRDRRLSGAMDESSDVNPNG